MILVDPNILLKAPMQPTPAGEAAAAAAASGASNRLTASSRQQQQQQQQRRPESSVPKRMAELRRQPSGTGRLLELASELQVQSFGHSGVGVGG